MSATCLLSYERSSLSAYRKVTSLAARVAAVVTSADTYAEGRAVSLDMAKALAVVALLGWIWCEHF